MQFDAGARLGVYEVTGSLGAGGMGEVFRARDTKLNRDVAIKVLPSLFLADPERVARFTREAQTLAALNHPNIAHIHGLEETLGVRALVMELVEGDDLSAQIARGPLPIVDALAIARQITAALEAAHEQGIVHRDLKPANIKVRADGTAKVLDFGLAKAMAPEGADATAEAMHSPTFTAHATQLGMIVGTAAYMAPEQARGKAVDKRADIWAFGVVLYEMLTGRRAFEGEDVSEVLATVLKTEPNWGALPPATPPAVRRLLRRCLEKDPRKRLSAIGDARLELDEIEIPPVDQPAKPGPDRPGGVSIPLAAGVALVAVLVTAGMGALLITPGEAADAPRVTRLSFPLPEGDEVADEHLIPLAISPDGTQVAYVGLRAGVRRLFLRRLGDHDAAPLAGTEGARSPFFSPDGQWIGFFAQAQLKKIAVGSGAPQIVSDNVPDARGGTWGVDDFIYYAPTNVAPLFRVPAAGGAASEVTRLDRTRGEISHRWPQALPDGKVLFSLWTGPGPDEHSIVVVTPATGERQVLLSTGDTPRFAAGTHLAYGRMDALFAVPWEPSRTSLGNIVPLSLPEQPRLENEGGVNFAIAANGTLAYISGGPARFAQRVTWVDRAGSVEPLTMPERDYEAVKLSPDGQRAVVQIREGTIGLWLFDFARHTLTPFVTSGGANQGAVWAADGARIIYRGTRNGSRNLYSRAADGSGDETRLTTKDNVVQTPSSVSPDGQWLVFTEGGGPAASTATWAVRLASSAASSPAAGTLLELGKGLSNGQVSPDGRWLAYQSNASGQFEVYAMPFPGPGARIPVSVGGGENPIWSSDGRELFYTRQATTLAVTVTSGATLSVSAPKALFDGRFRGGLNAVTPFSVSPDRRFLRIQQVQPYRPITRIDVVLNWATQLKSAGSPSVR